MSSIRLIMLEKDHAESGLIPSSTISSILAAISEGAVGISSFWEKIREAQPSLQNQFETNRDEKPILEGFGDGLLVINWEFRCIESFQEYQPIRTDGRARRHNGRHSIEVPPGPEFHIGPEWHIKDHYFEESRH